MISAMAENDLVSGEVALVEVACRGPELVADKVLQHGDLGGREVVGLAPNCAALAYAAGWTSFFQRSSSTIRCRR